MSECQVYLNDEQKNYLIKYICDRRCVSMACMWVMTFLSLYCFGILVILSCGFTFSKALYVGAEILGFGLVCCIVFAIEFIKGFGKTFGYRCDIQCLQKDLYTLDYDDFGYREKDNGRHPYYICDNMGNLYICPRFLDYRNADTGSKFLYIKLENGRNYAIADK